MRYLLHDVFTDTVVRKPNNVAIVNEVGTSISYFELNKLANQYANFIQGLKKGARINPFVGIISPVHTQSIAAILGTLKIGCAYIPLDEYSPTSRLNYIIDNTNLDIIFVDPHWYEVHKELFKKNQVKWVVKLSEDKTTNKGKLQTLINVHASPTTEVKKINQVSDDLAYILHSSGSTGIPKGIMLTHRNARTFVDWMQKEFKLTEKDKVMSRAPFKFDLSVFDIFNTFKVGATLICFDWNKKRAEDNKHLDYVKLMEKEKATILYTTPSTFISLLNRGGLEKAKIPLREVMYAGEPFPVPQLKRLQRALPSTQIANIYGPTETNIVTYFWINKLSDNTEQIPLGEVVEDTEIIVVAETNDRMCEPNEIGEIWCRGGTVTLGYLGQDDKTNQHKIRSPFHPYPIYYWRTGDYGFRDTAGCLHYRGRKDHMVKVKGYRIEIGEVESAIAHCEGIDEFAVVAVPDEKYGNRLFCYYSLLAGSKVSEEKIIKVASKFIPHYMIPYKFICLESLPKTSSGKIDRVLLSNREKANKI